MYKIRELFDRELKIKLLKRLRDCIIRVGIPFLIILIFTNYYFFSIEVSNSMSPTIKNYDLLLLKKDTDFLRGDIVCFKIKKKVYLKRIIALPNEIIEVEDGFVYIDGKKLTENYIKEKPLYNYEVNLVPQDSYFVLGDNRNDSEDSTSFGFVSKENIKGKVKFIFPSFFDYIVNLFKKNK